jgi:hypothetical protein
MKDCFIIHFNVFYCPYVPIVFILTRMARKARKNTEGFYGASDQISLA